MSEIIKKKSERKNELVWAAIFIPLGIVSVIFPFWAVYKMSGYMGAMNGFGVFPRAALISFADCIDIFTYIIKEHPRGIAKIVSYVISIIVSSMLILAMYVMFFNDAINKINFYLLDRGILR